MNAHQYAISEYPDVEDIYRRLNGVDRPTLTSGQAPDHANISQLF